MPEPAGREGDVDGVEALAGVGAVLQVVDPRAEAVGPHSEFLEDADAATPYGNRRSGCARLGSLFVSGRFVACGEQAADRRQSADSGTNY
ncbi:hypothetical protein GCM10009738_82060 [Kitasatospora viridis]